MKNKKNVTYFKQGKHENLPVEVVLRTEKVFYKKSYFKDEVFRASDFNTASWEWLCKPLSDLARESNLNPMYEPEDLLRALKIAYRLPSWKEMIALPIEDVKLENLIQLFTTFELEVLSSVTVSQYKAERISSKFRRFITKYVKAKSSDTRLGRLGRFYVSKIQKKTSGRELISDIPDGKRTPLGAIQHLDIEDLIKRQSEILRSDLEVIQNACLGVLKRHQLAIKELQRLENLQISEEDERSILNALPKNLSIRKIPIELTPEKQDYLLAMTVQVAKGKRSGTYVDNRGRERKFRLLEALVPMLRARLYELPNGTSISALANIDIAPCGEVILSCALILQLQTKWNFTSVLEIPESAIRITSFPHSLQSVKTRTRDHTPIVFVLASDEATIMACSVLVDRLERIRKSAKGKCGNISIWASSRSVLRGGPYTSLVGWGTTLKSFNRKYGLVDFSFEQLRVQRLSEIHVQTGSLHDVKFEAGHTRLQTSMHYVDKLMLRRTNSAVLLEFEKRLDATIRYMIDPTRVAKEQKLIRYPLGDGTSCSSPTNPPEEKWLIAGVCNAKECCTNGGCRNRAIEVTEDRIEEVILLRRFYERNWNRLLNENEDEFRKYHEPALIFNFAFYGILQKGPYRHLVKKYEAPAKTN